MRTVSVFLTATVLALSTATFIANASEPSMDHSQMSGMSDMKAMPGMNMKKSDDAATIYSGTGTIKSWGDSAVSIAHHPIAQLNWPAMTMSFDLSGYQGATFTAGQQVDFTFRQTDSGYALVSVSAK